MFCFMSISLHNFSPRYLDEEDTTVERAPNHMAFDFEPLEEDEKTLEKMEEYETKYRFR